MPDDEILVSLRSFDPIGLDGMEPVKLMNRINVKYLFSVRKLNDLTDLLEGKYKVLEIENLRTFPYHTTYMDTPDYLFYNQHVRGILERHKIRYRKYEATGTSFLEIKQKTNKGRTIKWRIINQFTSSGFDVKADFFIREHFPANSLVINPVLINRFTRATLIGLETNERITVDYNISFSEPYFGLHTEMPYLAIVELKKEGYSRFSPFNNIIKQLGIYPTRFSKYCIGSVLLNDSLKKNNLKPTLLLLNKIENEYNMSTYN